MNHKTNARVIIHNQAFFIAISTFLPWTNLSIIAPFINMAQLEFYGNGHIKYIDQLKTNSKNEYAIK